MGINIHRYKHDWLMAIGIIVFLLSTYGGAIYSQKENLKEQQLILELRTFRNAVAVFYEINKRAPKSLEELAETYYYEDRKKLPYLAHNLMQKILNGKMLDPFGRPYVYDKEKGLIVTESEDRFK